MSQKMKGCFPEEIFDGVGRKVGNYKGRPVPNDLVASRDRRNIGNVGSGIDNGQRGSRSGRMSRLTSNIE